MKASYRPQFLTDIEETADYLYAQAGDDLVARWRQAVKQTRKLVTQFPEIGHLRADLPIEGIRTFYVKGFPNWLIFYHIAKDHIEFLRAKHAMMHLPGLFEPPASEG
jgi:plasmid stabilization system protein ParE